MIITAAIRFEVNNKKVVIPCVRHSDGYELAAQLGFKLVNVEVEEGFVDSLNNFYDRSAAYSECLKNHQLPKTVTTYKHSIGENILFSEDLY